jgi:regulator of RNase E activity RraA
MTHVHRALGFVGAIVDGGVRDVDEIRAAGFPVFARDIVVSHAYVHHVEPGATVEVDGLVVRPGDLIHADKHGAVVIPREIAADIADASNRIELAESKMIELTQSSTCTLDDIKSALIELREEFVA